MLLIEALVLPNSISYNISKPKQIISLCFILHFQLLCPVAPLRGFLGILVYGFPFLPIVLKCDVRNTRGSCVPQPSLASVLACVEYLV